MSVGERRRNVDQKVEQNNGIPFAKPPIGELRFQKPVPPDPWTGVLSAKKFAPRAIQKDVTMFDSWEKGTASEDCLYLNVFTPAWEAPEGGFPVMFYVHGGAFAMETPISLGDVGICEALVQKGVVVVTFQYRLGYMGFFYTGDETCASNVALWDQCEALKWVHANIGAFGGDAGNITLFGQSAGGASVDLLHLSPHTTNLFHRFIPMAGNACAHWVLSPCMKLQCEKKARQLGITFESSYEMMRKLRELPASALAINMFTNNQEKDVDLECTPVLDGPDGFLPAPLDELRRRATPKPMMTGVCKNEALLFLIDRKTTLEDLPVFMAINVPDGVEDAENVRKQFLKDYIGNTIPETPQEIYRTVLTIYSEYVMNYHTLKVAQETAKIQGAASPVYLYRFDHHNPKSFSWIRFFMQLTDATHCTELAYLFKKGTIWGFTFLEDDLKMTETFSTAFTQFAKTGNPNIAVDDGSSHGLVADWRPLNVANPERHMIFDLSCHSSDSFFDGRPAKVMKYVEEAARNKA